MLSNQVLNNTKLKSIGIYTLKDLLYYFPRGYDNQTNLKKISQLQEGEYTVIRGKVLNLSTNFFNSGKKIVKATVGDETGALEIVWFSAPYIAKTLKTGEEYYFIGAPKGGFHLQMVNPQHKLASSKDFSMESFSENGEILPIYPLIKSVSQNFIKKQIKEVLLKLKNRVNIEMKNDEFFENIPREILISENLMGRYEALWNIHFPKNQELLEKAQKRFAFEELFILEMGILSSRYYVDHSNHLKYILQDKKNYTKKFLQGLPFQLTNSQKRVITKIYQELSQGKIVNRLVQGDVGSGKTIVSMVLLLYMAENSYQGVIMAPTEILATQHYLAHRDEFEALGIKVELLVGSLTAKNKGKVLERIRNGEVDIVVGTHALIQEGVEFKNLGLIVIDEQHRFGVEQRKAIRDKGVLANLIVMSATPIPRTLALSIYGDLDLSIINELPPGRKPIRTKLLTGDRDKNKMYDFIEKKISEGRQAYFIAPLIEESEKSQSQSVIELYSEVANRFPNFKVEVLHGKMKSVEKDEVMERFKNGQTHIIISTTVIEVGVNVPNATIITIASAQRFGLSSLHQLRGRVGRGSEQSYCFLLCDNENENSLERMRVMEATNDGFVIAEEDLKLRKPGEIFGTRQSGLVDFRFVDIIHDIQMIEKTRELCINYLEKNSGEIPCETLKQEIINKFQVNTNK